MPTFKRIVLALTLLMTGLVPGRADERVLLFVSDVQVARDGELRVTETIHIRSEGREIRRGFLRDFPTQYRRPDGTRVEVGFQVESVTRDGAPEPFAIERLWNGTRVRIGSADVLLNNGVHQYVVTYRTTRQIGYFASFDELYWNATGTGWTFPIEVAEARITLPEKVPFRQSAVYTGPQDGHGSDAIVAEQEPGRIVFRTTKMLPPRHGLTVAAGWDKGLIAEPGAAQRAQWWLADNLPLAVGGGGLALVILFYAFAWLLVGRDPRRGTIVPLFSAPEGLSAAAVRQIWRQEFDDRSFAAAVLDLAVKGHLSIRDDDGKMQLSRGTAGRPIGPAETALKEKLFGAKSKLTLSNTNHETISAAREALKERLSKTEERLVRRNAPWARGGHIIWFATLLALFGVLVWTRDFQWALVPLGGLALADPGLRVLTVTARWLWRDGFGANQLIALLFAVAFTAVGIGIILFGRPDRVELAALAAILAIAVISVVASPLLKAPTAEGRKVLDGIEGLRRYLGVAEEDRLEMLHPPEKTPELFERLLPYAIALDVENTWAQRFAGVLSAAATSVVTTSHGVTTWYAGNRDALRRPGAFVERLGSDMTQTIAAASSPPGSSGSYSSSSSSGGGSSSSGSSGGGSSGGGGGGGGGSGW